MFVFWWEFIDLGFGFFVINNIRAYDRAAIKFRGLDADINFNISDYDEDIKHVGDKNSKKKKIFKIWYCVLFWVLNFELFLQMSNFSKEEFVHILRRQSTGFSRGSSKYRGVTLHKCGRWEARMGQFMGKKWENLLSILISYFNGRLVHWLETVFGGNLVVVSLEFFLLALAHLCDLG